MTSPSRRKPRITRSNTRRSSRIEQAAPWAAALLLVLTGPLAAAEPETPSADAVDPILRLKQRSAFGRWNEASRRAGRESTEIDRPLGKPAVATVETPDAEPSFEWNSATQAERLIVSSDDPAAEFGLEADIPNAPPTTLGVPAPTAAVGEPRSPDSDSPFLLGARPAVTPTEDETAVDSLARQPSDAVDGDPFERQPLPDPDDVVRRVRPGTRYQRISPEDLPGIDEILPYADYAPGGPPVTEGPDRDVKLGDPTDAARLIPASLYTWEATNLFHNPLYFEDKKLERYGHTHHCLLQPFVSAGTFGTQLIGLPYQMTIDPICSHRYVLGYYRPGECTPKKWYQIPLNGHAAAAQAGVVTGAIFLFP